MSNHKHFCGHTDTEEVINGSPKSAEGCGHIWEHERVDPFAALFKGISLKEVIRLNLEAHRCPSCGKGPWYLIYKGVLEDEQGNRTRKPSQQHF